MKELQYPFDSHYILQKKKSLRRSLLSDGSARFPKKIAVLGGSTTSDIVRILELFLLDQGIEPSFYECEYGQYEQEALFPGDDLKAFQPDLIFLHTSSRNIRNWPEASDTPGVICQKLADETSRFQTIWNSLRDHFHCPMIQNNFEAPFFRLLGNADCWDLRGRSHFISELNRALEAYAREHEDFYISDLNYTSADFGLSRFSDPYYWNMYKYCMCLDAIPCFAHSLASLIKAIFGRGKKVLALDLDNTLWGGVIGDDGVSGIEIGQENGTAQSYYEFQQYVKQLKSLGIVLSVCSKNDEENALEGLNHPEGFLKPDDFAVIKANWDNKDSNILQTAQELGLLPESIVFADDNPVERDIVTARFPGIAAPVMDRVENYILHLDRGGYFEPASLNEDDLKRAQMYQENKKRDIERAQFSDYGEYLSSLNMEAEIGEFIPMYIPRITQLTNKSNQFNLTTRRYTPDEMEAVMNSPEYIGLYGKLTDKFGDNGLVSVVVGHIAGDVLDIDLWLMSCRVLKRDMEYAMLDALAAEAAARNISVIRGYYFPTKKNHMVKDLYESFGFTKISEDENGSTVWELNTSGYTSKNRYIRLL